MNIQIVTLKKMLFSALCLYLLSFTFACNNSDSNHSKMIHEMGSQVMPFDLNKTIHIFKMTESGGIQQVIVRDKKDTDQVALIRTHLKHEAEMFSKGNYEDPVSLHGKNMPGIKALTAGAKKIKVTYSILENGAQISYHTSNLSLITAVHQWFGAQLSDHGKDATYR